MKQSVRDLLDDGHAQVPTVPVAVALDQHARDDAVFVDLRSPQRIARDGRIPGAGQMEADALHAIDPAALHRHLAFASGKPVVFYCEHGLRSALAALAAEEMGIRVAAHLAGGLRAWRAAGGPIERPRARPAPDRRAPDRRESDRRESGRVAA